MAENLLSDQQQKHSKRHSSKETTARKVRGLFMSAQQASQNFQQSQADIPAQFNVPYAEQIGQVSVPAPIQSLYDSGQMSVDEIALAKRFFYEVHQSNLLPQLNDQSSQASAQDQQRAKEIDTHVRGIFSLLNSVDEQLLGTVCALLLEMKLSGQDQVLPVEEVGRRIMGYSSTEANSAAGATLLRAALWIVRFGYQHPKLCQVLLQEKKSTIGQDGQPDGW